MEKPSKRRLDDLLVARGLFADRGEALRAVIAGEVLVDDAVAASAAEKVPEGADVRLRTRGDGRFVSRGGRKLQAALDAFGVSVEGLSCCDVGASTGGFTDCLLQAGAAHVACVDVNYGQLAWKVRSSPRVSAFERTNIRTADPAALGAPFDLVAIDVSFIGLAQLAPVLARLCAPGSTLLALVKPQLESQRGESDRGVVRSQDVRLRTVAEVESALADAGFRVSGAIESPVRGPAGNVEYLVHAQYEG